MSFETFRRQRAPVSTEPTITIQKKGNLSINPPAYKALGEPEHVELLYDRERRLMGMRKVAAGTDSAYIVRPLSERESSFLISGIAFASYYGIPTEVARRWTARVEGDLLIIDLNEPSTEITSNRYLNRERSLSPS